jgi:hypothetical protein
MQKYTLKEGHSVIFTRTSDGTEISFTPREFNDQLGDLLCQNNQEHLLIINPEWQNANITEKKTFAQITENVILLTSSPDQTANNSQNQTVSGPSLKRKPGRQRVNKA